MKYTMRKTKGGYTVYEGRRKLSKFENLNVAQAYLFDKQHPIQTYGHATHPKTGEPATPGMMWIQNIISNEYILVSNRTPYTLSVQSETYWCS